MKKTETILVFYQKLPVYNPQFRKGEPYIRTYLHNGRSSNYGEFTRKGTLESDGMRYPDNVLVYPPVSHTLHPTQKPVELCEYLIRTYTREGEIVADICAGSGTTAVAAFHAGRRFICFENNPAYFEIARDRIDQICRKEGGENIAGGSGEQVSDFGD